MIRAVLILLGCCIAVVLIAAVKADPHLWGSLLSLADHQARSHGNQLNGQVARFVTPRSTP